MMSLSSLPELVMTVTAAKSARETLPVLTVLALRLNNFVVVTFRTGFFNDFERSFWGSSNDRSPTNVDGKLETVSG